MNCACIPNRVVCPEAERLWDAVADAHHVITLARRLFALERERRPIRERRYRSTSEALDRAVLAYEAAVRAFDDHIAAAQAARDLEAVSATKGLL